MRLLLLDGLRRTKWWTLLLGVFVAAGWYWAPDLRGEEGRLYAWSMGAALMIGRQWLFEPRVVWYLPVPRPDVWRAWWIVQTLGVTVFLLVMKLPFALAGPARDVLGISELLLSTTYDFAATGLGAILAILYSRPRPAGLLRLVWSPIQAVAMVGVTAGLPLALYLPQVLGVQPAVRWSDLSIRAWAIVAAAVAISIFAYFAAPGPPVLAAARAKASGTPRPVRSHSDRSALTGLPILLTQEYGFALALAGSFVVASTLFVLFMSGSFKPPADALDIIRADLAMLGGARVERSDDMSMLNLMLVYGVLMATLATRFGAAARLLRTLPIGISRLTALLVTWPAVIWLTAWLVVFLAHFAFLGRPPSASSVLPFVGLIGFSAIVQALSLRLSGAGKYGVFSAAMVALPLIQFLGRPSPVAAASIGLASVAAAAAINRVALARNSTYKPGDSMLLPLRIESK